MPNHETMPLRMLLWLSFWGTIAWLGLHWRDLIASTFAMSVCGPHNGSWDSVAKNTLARCDVRFETRGIERDDNCERISYLVELNGHHSVEEMTRALEHAGLRSVSWDVATKKNLIR